jgi:3-oxoadipate enol-lactonase
MPVTITESTSMDYDINGDGPPLLLISGLGFGRWGWFKQVPAFSRHFRTITFDTRGERRLENGVGTLVRDVVSLLDHLGVKKAPRLRSFARRLCGAGAGVAQARPCRPSGPRLH